MTRVFGSLLAALLRRSGAASDFREPVVIQGAPRLEDNWKFQTHVAHPEDIRQGERLKKLLESGEPIPVKITRYDNLGRPVEVTSIPKDELRVFDISGKARQPDIDGFDKRADREARWRRDGCVELEKLVPFMKNAGVHKEIIEHAEEVLRDLQEIRRRKYPNKGPE